MGQKTNPIGLRVAVTRDWRSKWYAGKKEFGKLLTEDRQIRELLKKKLESASVPQINIARVEQYHWGRVPLHTLRANIEYGFAEANTVYGKLGIKCWICKGETKAERPQPQA